MPVDVQALDCDFFVFSGHKVFAPTGIGVRLRQARESRRHAAVAGRRQHDRGRHVRADGLPAAARALRGRHRQHRRRGRARRGARLRRRASASRTSRATSTSCSTYAHEASADGARACSMIGTAREQGRRAVVRARRAAAPRRSARRSTRRASPCAPGHHCAQPILRRFGVEAPCGRRSRSTTRCEDIDALVAAVLRIATRRTQRS